MRNGRGTCNDLLKACYDVVCMLRINVKLEIYQKKAGYLCLKRVRGGKNRKIINSLTWQGLQLHSYIVHTSMVQL